MLSHTLWVLVAALLVQAPVQAATPTPPAPTWTPGPAQPKVSPLATPSQSGGGISTAESASPLATPGVPPEVNTTEDQQADQAVSRTWLIASTCGLGAMAALMWIRYVWRHKTPTEAQHKE